MGQVRGVSCKIIFRKAKHLFIRFDIDLMNLQGHGEDGSVSE